MIVGGTGFYIQALLYDIEFEDNDADTSYRQELYQLEKEKGAVYLYEMLKMWILNQQRAYITEM